MSTVTIMSAKTTTGAGSTFPVNNIYAGDVKSFHCFMTGSGALTATVLIEVSNDGTYWNSDASSTVYLSGTNSANNGTVMVANWEYVRANVSAISGTSAAVSVIMGTR